MSDTHLGDKEANSIPEECRVDCFSEMSFLWFDQHDKLSVGTQEFISLCANSDNEYAIEFC